MTRRARLLATAMMVGLTGPVAADPIALLIGNEDYERLSDVRRGDEVTGAEDSLSDVGVRVVAAAEADLGDMQAALSEFGQMTRDADAMLIVLSGRFVHSEVETYFLPIDAEPQSLVTLPANALPLSTVLAWLQSVPGKAVLAIAGDNTRGDFGPFLEIGLGDIEVPQGVTLVRAGPRTMARFISATLAEPGASIEQGAQSGDVRINGFIAADQVFLSEAAPAIVSPPDPSDDASDEDRLRDRLAWRRAEQDNTSDAYRGYIQAYPNGDFVDMARNRIASLNESPEARAERIEQSLDLTRDQRREIQRDLSLLDYNTRGIDGIFGRGTRAAVRAWQGDQDFDQTGFLSREQIERLDDQAALRAQELEEEAERRRLQLQAQDDAYWDETGAFGDEAGLRAYLERYPDGLHAEDAQAALGEIEQRKRDRAGARDRTLWDQARSIEYLDRSPDGAFRDEARTRITALRAEASGANSAAAREEQALNLSPTTARVIEGRLDALGLNPGRVDGVFDNDTRRAIRRYQQSRNLPETGYLNENVVVQLLADSVRSIFR